MAEPMKVLYRNFTPSLIPTKQEGSSMSPEIDIVDSLPWHVSALKSNLREEDANEVLRFGASIQHTLWRGYRDSVYRKTALIDGKPAAMFGCVGVLLGGKAQIWLLTTPDIYKISPLRFTRTYQEEVKKMLGMFPRLENYVDAKYAAAIRLLEIVGFSIGESEPLGYNDAMFRKFWIGRN